MTEEEKNMMIIFTTLDPERKLQLLAYLQLLLAEPKKGAADSDLSA